MFAGLVEWWALRRQIKHLVRSSMRLRAEQPHLSGRPLYRAVLIEVSKVEPSEADEILRCAEQSLDDWTNPDARPLGLREVLHFIVLTQHVRERRAGTAVDLDLLLRRLVPDDL
ncbi:MAG TPA: hypothetical protein PLW10_20790 [Myxococcota bacterium]|nr:hypothetical protein [Myxococcota bacterium]